MFFIKKIIKEIIIFITKKINIYPDNLYDQKKISYNSIDIYYSPSNDLVKRRWLKFQKDGKEQNTIDWINSFKDHEVFFDIGANIGVFAIYAGLKHKMKVYAFEAEVNSFIDLSKAIRLNKCRNITPVLIALSDIKSTNYFNYKNEFSSGHSSHNFGDQVQSNFSYLMCSDKIDNLISSKTILEPNYIKIDIDGNEKQVLQGMENTLKLQSLKSVLIEVSNDDEIKYFHNYFEALDFKLTRSPTGNNKNYIYSKNLNS
tara:strand:+ start:846 stop:1619 length:774 start_codon:yes stop_codon:yes gene_type:complete